MDFWLGTHMTNWLAVSDVPLMVSHRRLRKRKTLPRALAPWVLDSGGFTELSTYGRWTISEGEYVDAVNRYAQDIGKLEWAAPQDWMCEPWIIAKTGLSVGTHQERTVASYLSLRLQGPWFIPVLQGWTLGDYERHVRMYEDAGVDLFSLPVVGLGSVCRRQASGQIEDIVLSLRGIRLHGFGVKADGLSAYGYLLESADSMAWSFEGRMRGPHTKSNKKGRLIHQCGNHLHYALEWRSRLLANQTHQLHLAGVP